MQHAIPLLSEIISTAMLDKSTFDLAESVYAEVFRSPESFCIDDFSGLQRDEMLEMMVGELTSDLHAINVDGDFDPSLFCGEDDNFCDYEVECTPVARGVSHDDAMSMIASGIRFVYLCNYKGEDSGIALEDLTGGVRTFVSKWNYA